MGYKGRQRVTGSYNGATLLLLGIISGLSGVVCSFIRRGRLLMFFWNDLT